MSAKELSDIFTAMGQIKLKLEDIQEKLNFAESAQNKIDDFESRLMLIEQNNKHMLERVEKLENKMATSC